MLENNSEKLPMTRGISLTLWRWGVATCNKRTRAGNCPYILFSSLPYLRVPQANVDLSLNSSNMDISHIRRFMLRFCHLKQNPLRPNGPRNVLLTDQVNSTHTNIRGFSRSLAGKGRLWGNRIIVAPAMRGKGECVKTYAATRA